MILDDIKKLERKIQNLQMMIDSFSTDSAIRYDKEKIQSSGNSRQFEDMMLNLIEDERKLEHLKAVKARLVSCVPINKFTKRQQKFINLYFFQDYKMKDCCRMMDVKISTLCRMKSRIYRNFC